MTQGSPVSTRSQIYQIVIQGQLGTKWGHWFDGWTVKVDETRNATTITGPVADQAALRGVLTKMWNLNLTVVSVTCLEQQAPTDHQRRCQMTENVALEIRGMSKSYGKVEALRGIDLEVRYGEIFGFLGPNGAGKTTTIRCLLDAIRPDAGSARVLGIDPQADPVAVKARTGYLPGELHLDDNMTAERQLRYLNDLRGGKADREHIRDLARRLDLNLERPIKNLSKGNKQKVGVVQALMHRPELLILDEPTGGLDPLMQKEVLGLIQEAKEEGATVFFSSHVMSEVEAVAERVGIIRQGKVVEVAEPGQLVDRSLRDVTVRFKQQVDVNRLAGLPGVTILSQDDGASVVLQVTGEMDGLIKALAGLPVRDVETERPSLEDIFLAYYKA